MPIHRTSLARVDGPVGPYLAEGRPVVARGLARSWPAVGGWTPASFAARFGEQRVELHAFTRRGAVSTTVAEFVQRLSAGRAGDLYLAWDDRVIRDNPALAREIDFRPLFPWRLGVVYTALWMGGASAHTPLHFDAGAPNLHAVVHGRKRFVFFAPEDTPRLYPSDVYEWSTTFSEIDLRAPDLARHPRLAEATAFEAILDPGDVVHIPVGWWHAAWCLEDTISVNGWWLGPRSVLSARRARELGRLLLHRAGLYARDRCTCCGHGDLRRHLGWRDAPGAS